MVGFIRWCATTNKGTLIIMRFNEANVVQRFRDETGITAYSGIAAELQFNAWLVDKLENDPDSLVEILYVFNITEEVHNNLTGGVNSKNVVTDALGLDMDYILGLGLTNIADQRVATNYETGSLTQEQIKQIGIDAANMAIALFAAEGIDLEKDDYDLSVFTTAGYVRVNEQVMDMVFDGIYGVLGSRLSRATLLPVHNARYNPLYFQFSLEKDGEVISKTIYYDPESGDLTAENGSACSIQGVLLYDPPYDALMAWLWHNHICGGSSPGYLITNYIYENFPLTEDEQYALISTSVSCRDDIYTYLLGVSPGAGNYYSQRMTKDSTGNDILILSVYDSATNTRRVSIINWTGPKFAKGSNSYEEYIRLYWGDTSSPNLVSAPVITLSADTYVTEEEWNRIISGGDDSSNALEYIMGLPVRTKEDLIKVQGGSETPNEGSNSQGTETSSNGSLVTSSNGSGGSSLLSSGSVGTTGTAVNAATQTTTTEAGADTASDAGSAYEVTKTGAEGNDDTPWGTYAIVGIVSVLALGALGFFLKGGMFGG
ncbi:hypothetical protein GCM10025860_15540 [Methanobacterium ferruginis]|nr:hypothetical protein GCM10025860_15540 [Methanobacterium ferruginis]